MDWSDVEPGSAPAAFLFATAINPRQIWSRIGG
jgi:hypothetical protein